MWNGFLDGLTADLRPWLIRGDVGFGNEPVMREAERRRQPYLFKLRVTKGARVPVAPRAGAWIETEREGVLMSRRESQLSSNQIRY